MLQYHHKKGVDIVDKLMDHITIAIMLAAVISGVLENLKLKIKDHNIKLKSGTWLLISISVSGLMPMWLTKYYLGASTGDAFSITLITILGAQAFYTVFLQKKSDQ